MSSRDDVAQLLEQWFAREALPPDSSRLDHLTGPLLDVESVLVEQERCAARAGVERGDMTVRGAIAELPSEDRLAAHVAAVAAGQPAADVEVGVQIEMHCEPWRVRPDSAVARGAKPPRPVVTTAVHSLQDAARIRWTPLGWRISDKREAGSWFSDHLCRHVFGQGRLGHVRIQTLMMFRGEISDAVALYLALHNPGEATCSVTPKVEGSRLFGKDPAWELEPRSTTIVGINAALTPDADLLTKWSLGSGLKAKHATVRIEHPGPGHPGTAGWCRLAL